MKQNPGEPTPPPVATPPLPRLPSLDGWRALSIFMVLAFHAGFVHGFSPVLKHFPLFGLFSDGDLGVRFFFTISGFLITWLMIMEADKTGVVNRKAFYIRRCLRIFPVYFAFLAVLAVLQYLAVFTQDHASWIGNLTFTRNYLGGSNVSNGLWSLSVEEQFYILWPTIFIWLGSGKNSHRALLFLGAAVAIAPLFKMTWLNQLCPAFFSPLLSVNSFFSRYVSLAAGCFSAVLLARHYQSVAAYLKSRSWMIIILGISLINLTKFLDVWWVIRFGPLLQAIGFSLLLLQSVVAPEWCIYRPLNWGWVRQIGVLSYSIYIWQALFWSPPDWLGLGKIWWLGLWLPPLLIVAVLSYYGLERPLGRLRRQYHPG